MDRYRCEIVTSKPVWTKSIVCYSSAEDFILRVIEDGINPDIVMEGMLVSDTTDESIVFLKCADDILHIKHRRHANVDRRRQVSLSVLGYETLDGLASLAHRHLGAWDGTHWREESEPALKRKGEQKLWEAFGKTLRKQMSDWVSLLEDRNSQANERLSRLKSCAQTMFGSITVNIEGPDPEYMDDETRVRSILDAVSPSTLAAVVLKDLPRIRTDEEIADATA